MIQDLPCLWGLHGLTAFYPVKRNGLIIWASQLELMHPDPQGLLQIRKKNHKLRRQANPM